ncbi:hypothetical protein Tco_1467555 [Tanacetum coccineum]
MATLKYCDQHNMVALLEKTDGSEGFHPIVDFLNASHIKFVLSENPTIYDSHIKQFWQTATVNTLDNGEQEITAKVNVADEAAFIDVDVVHGGAATTISSIDTGQGSGNIPKSPTMPYDLPLLGGHTLGSDEGSMTLHELTILRTKLSNKVDNLEIELKQTKQTYGAAFTKLIKRVKKLEQTVKTSQARKKAKIMVSDDDEEDEDPSKQGRSLIEEMDLDPGISLVPLQVSNAGPEVTTTDAELNTASTFVSIASPQRHADTTANDLTLTKTLMEIRKSAAKAKGKAVMQESEQPKKIKKKVQIQMSLDEELAQKLHEEEQAKFNADQEELLASETTEGEANLSVTDVDWDNVQAHIQADEDLAHRLLDEERESLSIAERERLLAKLIEKRKKLQVAQRYEAIRTKPKTILGKKGTKRAGQEVLEEPVKRQKIGEASGSSEEQSAEKEKELLEEELQKLLVIVPVEEVYVEALQVKYPIID